MLKLCSEDWSALEVHALHEGDEIEPWEPVLQIDGDYALFAHLETVYLGTLARRTRIMRNVREVVDAAGRKPILFFPARHDHWLVQTGDGWAAHVAAPSGCPRTPRRRGGAGAASARCPHGLIAAFGGDTVAAARAWADRFAGEMNVTVLVDFENDSVRTALEVADALGDRLWGVRLDTSELLVDRALWHEMGDFRPTGVNPVLVGEGPPGARRRRPPGSSHRGLGRIRRREDPRVREGGGAGGRLRCRIVARAGRERLHRGRRSGRWQRLCKGRPPLQRQRPARAGVVGLMLRPPMADWGSG